MTSHVDACVDFDTVDEVFLEENWLSSYPDNLLFDASDFPIPSDIDISSFKSVMNTGNGNPNGEEGSDLFPDSSSSATQQGEVAAGNQSFESGGQPTWCSLQTCEYGSISKSTVSSSLRERLNHAVGYIGESQKETDVLVQIWIPVKIGDRQVLTTHGQPFQLDPTCRRLVDYRTVSTSYNFSVENSGEALGMPGRVFLGRMPEWTPDVRFFHSYEYPRVNYAQSVDVRGSLALPVFDRHRKSCLGVVEVVMTTQKINYSADIDNICRALQAVELGSSEILCVPRLKVRSDSYLSVVPEIQEVLMAACQMHKLPLAQTWIPCTQECKGGSHPFIGCSAKCISTVDVACHVNDPSVLGFHETCSEHDLFIGQGVAGRAFTTTQPCFSPDVTAFSKTEYPLAHYARVFKLGAAVAIRLRSSYTGTADFVLEFFLPGSCVDSKDQKLMLHSLSSTIQQVSSSLRVVTEKELQGDVIFHDNRLIMMSSLPENQVSDEMLAVFQHGVPKEELMWSFSALEVQEKQRGMVQPSVIQFDSKSDPPQLDTTIQLENMEEHVSQTGEIFFELNNSQQRLVRDTDVWPKLVITKSKFSKSSKGTESRHAKTEKPISLQVLQQYFAGSLKDAAKSIGVCPTTLKRICRQHGITRWPSRKIKKVSHSLRKLQVVIDSVHGAKHAFAVNSLYEDLSKFIHAEENRQGIPANNNSTVSKFQEQSNQPESNTHSSSSSSSCSSSRGRVSSSNRSSSSCVMQSNVTPLVVTNSEILVEEENGLMLEIIDDEIELFTPKSSNRVSTQNPTSAMTTTNTHTENLSSACRRFQSEDSVRIKVVLGEETLRFKQPSTCGYQDLKDKIAKRFDIDAGSMVLKYLYDDSEWVTLTCDDDLHECIDMCKFSGNRAIKLWVESSERT